MNKKILDRIFWIIGADLRTSKSMDVVNNPVHKFMYDLHNVSFLMFLILAIIFYGDVFFLNGAMSTLFINVMGFSSEYLKYIEHDQIKLFYIACSLGAMGAGIFSSAYLYIKKNSNFIRENFIGEKIFYNIYITSIINVIFGFLLGVCGFFLGGYILSVYLIPWLGLDKIPGILIVQIMLAIKVNALITIGVFSTFSLLMPYGQKKTS